MQTASEVLNYTGNAAMGFGPDGIAHAGGDSNPGSGLARIIQDANNRNLNFNIQQWQQAIEDRNKSQELFKVEDIDFPIEEPDRQALKGIYDQMEKLYIQNPNLVANAEAYTKMRELRKEYSDMQALAKARSAAFTQQRLDISNDLDETSRADRQRFLAEQMAKPLTEPVVPYLKKLDFDELNKAEDLAAQAMITTGTKVGQDGLMRSLQKTDPLAMHKVYDVISQSEGNFKTMPNQAKIRYKYLLEDPRMNDEMFANLNKRINEINLENGWTEGSQYFLKPLAVAGPDGKMVPNQDAIEFNKSLFFANRYRSGVESLNKEAQEMKKIQAQQKEAEAGAFADRQRGNLYGTQSKEINELLPYKKAEYEAKIKAEEAKGNQVEAKRIAQVMQGAKPVSDAVNTFHNIDQRGGYQPVSKLLGSMAMDPIQQSSIKKELGIDDNAQMLAVPATEGIAYNMLSVPGYNQNNKKTKKRPAKVFAIKSPDGDPNKMRLIGLDAKGKLQKSVDFNQSINELIDYDSDYDNKRKVEKEGQAKLYLREIQGADVQGADLNLIRQRNTMVNNQPGGVPRRAAPAPAAAKPAPPVTNWPAEVPKDAELKNLTIEGKPYRAWKKGNSVWKEVDGVVTQIK